MSITMVAHIFLVLILAVAVSAYYLPGSKPVDYGVDDKIELKVCQRKLYLKNNSLRRIIILHYFNYKLIVNTP